MKLSAVIRSMDFRQLWSLFWLSIRHLRFVLPTIRGTRRTVAICTKLYENKHHLNGPENAFRHALWNVIIVKRSLGKNLPLDRSLAWAKTITDWHEDFSPNEPLARAMDLHNNRIGRDLIAKFPEESVDALVEKLVKMVPLSRKHTQIHQLKEDKGVLVHIEE